MIPETDAGRLAVWARKAFQRRSHDEPRQSAPAASGIR